MFRKMDAGFTPVDYIHSSAKVYITGIHQYPVLNFKNLHDMNLTIGYPPE